MSYHILNYSIILIKSYSVRSHQTRIHHSSLYIRWKYNKNQKAGQQSSQPEPTDIAVTFSQRNVVYLERNSVTRFLSSLLYMYVWTSSLFDRLLTRLSKLTYFRYLVWERTKIMFKIATSLAGMIISLQTVKLLAPDSNPASVAVKNPWGSLCNTDKSQGQDAPVAHPHTLPPLI